ncbi:thiamine diphosphokinase [Collinsella provencensis]|uniref:thiamine diphosphokinase n=1 Tax=Collinsella provencensis TaxID=1937461 RepID=UPI000C82D7F6|nr:thiamine diphosphokinase [Collinsella provencensis]
MRVLIVGGSPEPSSAVLVANLAAQCNAVVAVDRGLDVLLEVGIACDLFCGDADSVSERGAELVHACEAGKQGLVCAVERYDPHKDYTDLALALRAIDERWPDAQLVCTCLTGGNPDHALAVYGRLAACRESLIELREDGFRSYVLHGPFMLHVEDAWGKRFSFVPLSPEAVVSEFGMRWELNCAPVELLSDLGISNVIESNNALFTCHEGVVVAWVFD